jgi:hypothetical protein
LESQHKPRCSWQQFVAAVSVIPLGWFWSMVWLGIGLGAGDSWIEPIAEAGFVSGPWIMGIGALWLIVLVFVGPVRITQRFSLRALLIAATLVARDIVNCCG